MKRNVKIKSERSTLSRVLSFCLAMNLPFAAICALVSNAKADGSSNVVASDNLKEVNISPEFIEFLNYGLDRGMSSLRFSEVLNTMSDIKAKNEKKTATKIIKNPEGIPITINDFIDYGALSQNPIDAVRIHDFNQNMANLEESYRLDRGINILENEYFKAARAALNEDIFLFNLGGRTCMGYIGGGNLVEFFRVYMPREVPKAILNKAFYYEKIVATGSFEVREGFKVADLNCENYWEAVINQYFTLLGNYSISINEAAINLSDNCDQATKEAGK